MAQAMQKTVSVAEQKARSIVQYDQDRDPQLLTLLDVWCAEQADRDERAAGDHHCFGQMATDRARWCIELCAIVPAGKYPKSRKFLAMHIADGLLGAKDYPSRELFARTLAVWPAEDLKIPADALREIIEFRWKGHSYDKERLPTLVAFFAALAQRPQNLNEEVVRTSIKAVASWVSVDDLLMLGKCLAVLQGPMQKPFSDFVQHALER